MTLPAPRHRYTFEEYLDLEEIAGVRHEYYQGEIYGMPGGTPEHAAMAAAITAALGRQLGATPCRVYSTTHVTNPKLVVEVSSPSTADYDRGEKLQHYQQIPSLELVLLFDHTNPRVDLWTRTPEGWRSQRFGAGESIRLQALSCTLEVDEVYAAARGA